MTSAAGAKPTRRFNPRRLFVSHRAAWTPALAENPGYPGLSTASEYLVYLRLRSQGRTGLPDPAARTGSHNLIRFKPPREIS